MAQILIVDDDADTREVLCKFLDGRGHRTQCVPNGREAIGLILTSPPDLIILDLSMPEMCGAALLEVLRSYLRLQNLPVIVFTGLEQGPVVERARELGAGAVLIKAKTSLEQLHRIIGQQLSKVRRSSSDAS
jgi:CheY-like chemotaxis protein